MSTLTATEDKQLPTRITLRIVYNPKHAKEVFTTEDKRKSFACLRWSIDRFGNDFWVAFDREDNLKFTLSCRYAGEAKLLAAIANYVSQRFNCEILTND